MLKVRRVQPSDRELLIEAARKDPYHAAIGLTGEHWTGSDSIFYEDEFGPVVALKTTNVVRVDIQFLTQDPKRNALALLQGFWTYMKILRTRNVKEIIFNTNSTNVAKFFRKRFHFADVKPGTYTLRID